MRPVEHALGRVHVHQFSLDEHLEYRTAEGFGECGDFMEREVHESAVRAKATIGDKQVQMRMPVGERAVGLDR